MDEKYLRKVLPYLKDDYFSSESDKIIFKHIRAFVEKYNQLPSTKALDVEISLEKNILDSVVKECSDKLGKFQSAPEKLDWIVTETEKFCQDKALYLALVDALKIAQDDKGGLSKGAIPGILTDALGVSFDPDIGHDYLKDADSRFDYYHEKTARLPFDLEMFNKITNGGIPKKTLNIFMAGVNVGKSLFLCHVSAAALLQGKNVLYITLELAEKEVGKRIDANLLNLDIDDIKSIPEDIYKKRVGSLRQKTTGKLIIKEYPTAAASVIHFKALLSELKLKQNFTPDLIVVDYINICSSARLKPGVANSYTYVQSIAQELRGLAVEHDVPIWSATQVTRTGFTNSDPGLEDTAESFGLPATADFMVVAVTSEELEKLNQLMIKQLKSRYGSKQSNKKFVIGIDIAHMRVYDVEQSAQQDITGANQAPSIQPTIPGKKLSFKDLKV